MIVRSFVDAVLQNDLQFCKPTREPPESQSVIYVALWHQCTGGLQQTQTKSARGKVTCGKDKVCCKRGCEIWLRKIETLYDKSFLVSNRADFSRCTEIV